MKSADRCDAYAYGKRRCPHRGIWLVTKDLKLWPGRKTALFCEEHYTDLQNERPVTRYVFAPDRNEDGSIKEVPDADPR